MHYNVEIPVSEIGYIYDYIFKRDSVKAVDDSVNELWETIEWSFLNRSYDAFCKIKFVPV